LPQCKKHFYTILISVWGEKWVYLIIKTGFCCDSKKKKVRDYGLLGLRASYLFAFIIEALRGAWGVINGGGA
jgi:hypothetical protein